MMNTVTYCSGVFSMKASQIIPFIDLTTLNATDGIKSVDYITKQAVVLEHLQLYPAAVCVYPTLVKQVRNHLPYHIAVASVTGGFPAGQTPLIIKIEETKAALDEGANEIDMVINRARLMDGDEQYVFDEIAAVKEQCGDKLLKVIIESGELVTKELIKKATHICIQAGANFVKTSTGKSSVGATPEAVKAICEEIGLCNKTKGFLTGIKISGGIATIEDANSYIQQVSNLLGTAYLSPHFFRIGASRLYDQLVFQILEN
ncbi:MAG: deoxyribose-phosphate aldolase [Flavobacteriales bacterium]|nr:deoxyribose-phosphate aldolase [Flavobacteriales bacterium]